MPLSVRTTGAGLTGGARLHAILCRYYFKSRRLAWILRKIKLNLTVAVVSLKINL